MKHIYLTEHSCGCGGKCGQNTFPFYHLGQYYLLTSNNCLHNTLSGAPKRDILLNHLNSISKDFDPKGFYPHERRYLSYEIQKIIRDDFVMQQNMAFEVNMLYCDSLYSRTKCVCTEMSYKDWLMKSIDSVDDYLKAVEYIRKRWLYEDKRTCGILLEQIYQLRTANLMDDCEDVHFVRAIDELIKMYKKNKYHNSPIYNNLININNESEHKRTV